MTPRILIFGKYINDQIKSHRNKKKAVEQAIHLFKLPEDNLL